MPFKNVLIPSSFGKLSATIHTPDTQTEKLAILCPGNVDSKDYDHLVGLAEQLCLNGYTVVRFDPTGTWESEGDISHYTTTQYLMDVKNILEFMLTQNTFTNVLLGGHSRGARVAILFAARDPRISTVLGIMPASSTTATLEQRALWEKNGFKISLRNIPGKNEKREFRIPFSFATDGEQYHVLEDVKKIHVPIILVAGELDTITRPEEVKRVFDTANERKKLILMNGIGHDYRHHPEEIELVNKKILEQLV